MVHTIFFDVGDTLIFSEDMFQWLGRKVDSKRKEIPVFIEKRFAEIYRNLEGRKFLKVSEIISIVLKDVSEKFATDDLSKFGRNLYYEFFVNNSKLFDDTVSVLGVIKQKNIKVIAISDADKEVLHKELEIFNLLRFFDGIVISSEIKSYKPSDNTVNKLLKFCKSPLSGILFVGNSKDDMETARKMGVKYVFVNRNNMDMRPKPDYIISSLSEVLDII